MSEALARFQTNEGKTYQIYPEIANEKVYFTNRFGITIVGDIFYPSTFSADKKYPAIVVSHPHGGVKEQSGGLYAQEMATKGYVTLAIDLSYNGESGGTARHISTPEGFVEDIIAAIDYIGTRNFVDREHIGLIGICGSGGFAVSAACFDPRIKAVATISMYDMGKATRQGIGNAISLDERKRILQHVAKQRWNEFTGAPIEYNGTFPRVITEDLLEAADPISREFMEYYCTKRGRHIHSTGQITINSTVALMSFYPFANMDLLAGRPILIISGDISHSREFSEDCFQQAQEPKELYLVPGASHTDLYDDKDKIPFAKLTDFFNAALK